MSSPSSSAVQLPPRKRRKTQLACNPCRTRKSGCDGVRPVCSTCESRGLRQQCAYQESVLHASSSSSSRPTISELQRRLERLEGSPLPRDAAAVAGSPLPGSGPPESTVLPPISAVRKATAYGPADPTRDGQSTDPSSLNPRRQNGSSTRSDDETIYGPSSNISFLRQVTLAADPHQADTPESNNHENRAADSTPTLLGFSTAQPRSPDPPPEPIMLPERWLADSLMSSFWEFVHPVFPILHRPSFVASYEALWQPSKGGGPPRHRRDPKDVVLNATLSIVLALGSQRTEQVSNAEQDDLADRFYKQSVRLVSVDVLDHSSLQVVQLLLLRGLYLHYTSHADRCWNTVGVALRVAQGLGLHSEGDKAAETNQLKREMRRRVWHCCITLDRLTATTFGRPVLLSRKYPVPAPAAIDDEHLSETTEAAQPADRPSYLAFFAHSLRLFDLLNDILVKFYADGDYALEHRAQALNDVLQLSSKLDDLSGEFPIHLREESISDGFSEDIRGCLQMQANILKSRVLWIRLLLLRPLLLAEAKQTARTPRPSPDSSTLRESFGRSANILCVTTAHGVLRELHGKLGSVRQNSAWHVLLFTFAAASTLVVATLCPGLDVSFDAEPAKTSWDRALTIFDFHKKHVASAARGIEVLQKFRESVAAVPRRPRGRERAEPPDDPRQEQDDASLLPFSSVPGMNQTPLAQDFGDFLSSDLLNESWFNNQGIDFGNWSIFQ